MLLKLVFISLITVLFFISCESGLKPTGADSRKSFLVVNFYYKNGIESWPEKDSMWAMRVAAFRDYPPKDIIGDVLIGRALFTLDSQPLYVDSSQARLEIPDPPDAFKYVVAAWQYDSSLTAQRVAGVYITDGGYENPAGVTIYPGESPEIDIHIDFENLPPQPF